MKRIIKVFGIFLMTILVIGMFTKKRINDETLAVYGNDELQSSIPKKGEALFKKAICDNDVKVSWDNDKWGLYVSNLKGKTKCNLYFYEGQTVFDFDYTGGEQTFTAPVSGTYKLETWGAQGGYFPNWQMGYGGYSSGYMQINKDNIFYIAVGGSGNIVNINDYSKIAKGGYNGGGAGARGHLSKYVPGGGGGGATSIQNSLIGDGQLKNYKNNISNIIIVSGGGGGAGGYAGLSGAGGGFKGSNSFSRTSETSTWGGNSIGGSQNNGYMFGIGQSANDKTISGGFGSEGNGGAGGGFYGGFVNINEGEYSNDASSGGSGYIGNSLLKNKVMYCYNCEESSEENTKTISTTCSEETPTENCAKKGNGYARITLVSIDE